MRLPNWSYATYLYSLVAIAFAAKVFWSFITGDITNRDLSIAYATALSTFLGALFAFRLNENKEHLKQQSEYKTSLKRALFILSRQTSAIDSIVKHLNHFQGKSEIERAMNLPAYKDSTYKEMRHNFDEIKFLLESEHVNLLMKITVEEDRFEHAFETLRLRGEFYVNEVTPLYERHALQGKAVTGAQFKEIMGERVFGTLLSYTNTLFTAFYETQISIRQVHAELFTTAKKMFPNELFIKELPTE